MEIQAGGDTNQTGNITSHVAVWESSPASVALRQTVAAAPNVLNVWKRLLGQLLTKGLAATRARQGVGCIMGQLLFDSISEWTTWSQLRAPEDGFSDFVVIPYRVSDATASPVRLEVNGDSVIRSTFQRFLDRLRDVGIGADFGGSYVRLDGEAIEGGQEQSQ
jgi:hypothetical protein